jgi:D-threo-aldose 1-dehydrogenase
MSRLGLGLSRLHYLATEKDRIRLIDTARDLGITHFDAARLYGDGVAERSLGLALGQNRPKVTVATKFGLLPNRLIEASPRLALPIRGVRSILRRIGFWRGPRRSWSVATLRSSLSSSLKLLRTDYVDILFLHDPRLNEISTNEDLLQAMAVEKQKGKIRFIGIAGDYDNAISLCQKYPNFFDILQVAELEWSDNGIIPDITFGALARGPQFFGTAGPDSNSARSRLVDALARRSRGAVLVGTSDATHLKQLVEVVE